MLDSNLASMLQPRLGETQEGMFFQGHLGADGLSGQHSFMLM